MPLNAVDSAVDEFAVSLSNVLGELERKVTDILASAVRGRDERYDAAALLNSRGDMLQALRDAGYSDLANEHVAKYPDIVESVKKDFGKRKLPPVEFSTASIDTFKQIATADLEAFNIIGTKAVDDLRHELYRGALANKPFSSMVDVIKAATVGLDKKGSPLKNYAYTYANTATLSFAGEAVKAAGEDLGAEKWEVVGPLDDATRDECRAALSDPIRTEKEWHSADYWGGSPGGWNCRHILYPVLK